MEGGMEIGVLTFHGSDAAERLIRSLSERGAGTLIDEVGLLEHHESGRFSVHAYQPGATRGQHAAMGAVVGTMVGMLLGPFGLVAGLLGGAAVGASMQGRNPHELEVSEHFVTRLRNSLPPGSSAVLIIGGSDVVGQLMGEIRSEDVVTRSELHEPLTDQQVTAIQERLGGAPGAG